MTREDINRINSQYLNDCESMSEMENIFELAIKALEQEPRWIPVNEKLPEIQNYSDSYLVTLKRGGVYIAMFTECDEKHWWTYDDVVAWMPLPKAYREAEEW